MRMQGMNEQLKEAVSEAIREALGEAVDCTRSWSAWGAGTMSEDDFSPVADDSERVAEIADAVLAVVAAQPSPGCQGDALRSFACEAVEYFRDRSDVVDGDYGSPSPNEEMKLLSEGEAALAARQPVGEPVGQENPLMPYVDSYRRMAKIGSGRVSCTAVADDIERNMAPHAAPPAQAVELARAKVKIAALELQLATYAATAQAVDVEDVLGKAMDMAKGGCGSASVVEWITEQLIDNQAVGK